MIILLNPKSANSGFRVPNSILAIGALLEGHYDYEILDQNTDKNVLNTIISLIRKKNAKYLGITVMPGPQLHHAIPISKKIKSLFPQVKIIWGGYFPTFHPNTILKSDYVDYAFKGNAENSFLNFINILEGKSTKSLKEISGLSYRTSNETTIRNDYPTGKTTESRIVHNERAGIPDTDEMPILPYHKVPVNKYLRTAKTHLGVRTMGYISSIGCPFLCGFCAIAGIHKGRWEGRTPELVYRDLKFLKDKYNIGALEFHDDNFFVSEKRSYGIAEKIVDLNLGWWAEGRPDTMMKFSDDTFRMLKKSGLKMIFYGAESSSQDMLDLMNKGGTQTPDTVLNLAERLKPFDIIPEFSFVLGGPSDKVDEDIDRDINFIRKIKEINPLAEIIIYIYSPVNFKESEMSIAAKSKGFNYPKTLDDWLSPQWKYFDIRKYPQTPWLKTSHIKKIKNFERTLNSMYPTLTDTKIRGWKRKLMETFGSWRYRTSFYIAPYELAVIQKLLKYRQPEIEGFAFEN